MAHFAVTAVGVDRPGIVAAVTAVFVEHGCNLEDSSMSILRGHFAMMLVVDAPPDLAAERLEADLHEPARRFDLVVAVRPIDDRVPRSPPGQDWSLAVYGADRPGIVHRFARLLADSGVNIVDLTTRIIGESDRPVYVMMVDVTLPAGLDVDGLRRQLADLAAELGVDCSLHPAQADVL
jgi:glycine cleavage system transcriptional repressor